MRYVMFILLVALVFGAISKWVVLPLLIAQKAEQKTYNKIAEKIYKKN